MEKTKEPALLTKPSLSSEGLKIEQFESRKVDHIRLAMDERTQAQGLAGLDRIELIHEALPDLDFSEVKIDWTSLGHEIATPFLVSSMTAGHAGAVDLNIRLAQACARRDWRMGVGSQRRELTDGEASREWVALRKAAGQVKLLGNLGIAQAIRSDVQQIQRLVDDLEAQAMIIHLNPLQECIQLEGTPEFKGGFKALKRLVKALSVPVIVKETGCGMSAKTIKRLEDTGVAAIDVSGLGGTHWGRIEGFRNASRQELATTFADWGISTVDSVWNARQVKGEFEIWASGGLRTGLDAAKLLAMGATTVGFAQPILAAALKGEEALDAEMDRLELELKVAMFCTGSSRIHHLRKVWQWKHLQKP